MSFVLLIAAAFVLGGAIMRRLGLRTGYGVLAVRMYVGMSACALLVLVVGGASLLAVQTLLFVLALLGLLVEVLDSTRRRTRPVGVKQGPLSPLEYTCVAAVGASLLLALLSAFAPASGYEAAVAHLALPEAYAEEGRIALSPGIPTRALQGAAHWLHCLLAVTFHRGGETPATLLNWGFAGLACAALFRLGERIAGRRAGLAATALFATAPVFMDQTGAVSAHLPFVGLTLGALLSVVAWFDMPRAGAPAWPERATDDYARHVLGRRVKFRVAYPGRPPEPVAWLVVAGGLAGSACGIRPAGLLVGGLLGVGVLFGPRRGRWRGVGALLGTMLLAAAPWLLRDAVVGGLSLSGLRQSVPPLSVEQLLAWLRVPWDLVMRPSLYGGWSRSPGGMLLAL